MKLELKQKERKKESKRERERFSVKAPKNDPKNFLHAMKERRVNRHCRQRWNETKKYAKKVYGDIETKIG